MGIILVIAAIVIVIVLLFTSKSYMEVPVYVIVFGVAGLLPPTTSALLHNASTLAISLKSMTNLLPEKKKI